MPPKKTIKDYDGKPVNINRNLGRIFGDTTTCTEGDHNYTEWYQDPENESRMERICSKCGIVDKMLKQDFV